VCEREACQELSFEKGNWKIYDWKFISQNLKFELKIEILFKDKNLDKPNTLLVRNPVKIQN